MTFFSKLLGRKGDQEAPPHGPGALPQPTSAAPLPAAAAPRPDPAARTREEEAALARALAAGDVAALSGLVLHASARAVRQRAAEAIGDPEEVRRLLRELRGGGDKNVFRILAAKRDAAQAVERRTRQLRSDAETVAAAIERHSHRVWDAVYVAQLEQLEKRWAELAEHADDALRGRVRADLARAEGVIEQHERAQAVAAGQAIAAEHARVQARERRERERAEASAAAEEAARRTAAEQEAEAQRQRLQAEALEQLTATVYRALGALKAGRTAQAARLHEQARERLAAVSEAPARLVRQLEKLEAALADIREWKAWSVAPKRAGLLQQMERLIGAEIAPPELARRIKQLQETWRTLDRGAAVDPGTEAEAQSERERFRELARRAWEPCGRHFEQQAQLRADNLARRNELNERLAAFVAEIAGEGAPESPAPDWRRVIRALAESQREWRRYVPVDRTAAQPAQERFNALTRALQERLDAEYERNLRARRAIIERAAKLLAGADTRQAAAEVKELQARWRATGVVPREQEEPLWREFRQHCDAVFQKRAEESASYAAGLDANRARATQLCDTLAALCDLGPDELLASAPAKLEELRRDFDALDLPRQSAAGLRQRFFKLERRLGAALGRAERSREQRVWTDLLDAADRVRRHAVSRLSGAAVETTEALRAEAEAFITAVAHWPRGGRAMIEQQLRRAEQLQAGTAAVADADTLRDLCVRAEVLAELPTPDVDQPRRRDYQMSRLVQGMGRGSAPEPAELDGLILEWIAAPAVEDTVYAPLRRRFDLCRERLGTRG